MEDKEGLNYCIKCSGYTSESKSILGPTDLSKFFVEFINADNIKPAFNSILRNWKHFYHGFVASYKKIQTAIWDQRISL